MRFHKASNTRLLRELIDSGRVRVDNLGRILKPDGDFYCTYANEGGYIRFQLRISGKQHWFFCHKAVVLTQHNDIPFGMQIDHINGDNQDNRPCNLKLVTEHENLSKRRYDAPAF